MFRHVAAFEWRYQLRSPVFWIGCVIFFLMAWGATVSDNIQIGSLGNVHKNGPVAILSTTVLMGVFSIFVTIGMVANVVVRDEETGFAPIIRSTSIGKASYLLGRFTGASAVAFLVLAMVPLGILVGSFTPGNDIEKIGPLRWGDYGYALFAFALPTLLLTAAAFFAVATATRSMMSTYVAAVGALVLYFIGRGATRNNPAWDRIAALLDPFGTSALSFATKYWSAAERNTRLPEFTGLLLANRLLWAGVAVALLVVAYRSFRFEMHFEDPAPRETAGDDGAPGRRLSRAEKAARAHRAELEALRGANPAGVREVLAADARRAAVTLPAIPPATSATGRAQLWELAQIDMAYVFRSPAFFILLAIGLLLAGVNQWFIGEFYGSPSYPVTRLMVKALNQGFGLFPLLIAAFYAGELVWRDRDRRVHEMIDATAAPDWVRLVPKVVAITLVLFSCAVIGVLCGIVMQTACGYTHYQVLDYVLWFIWPMTVTAVHVAILAIFVQVLVPHKATGWAVMLVYGVVVPILPGQGFDRILYLYGVTPDVPLSDLDGQGRFWIAQAWGQVYWTAFGVMLLVACHLLWRRGTTIDLRARLARARARLHGKPLAVLAGAGAAWAASGGWIFYNTDVLNRHVTTLDSERRLADMEKTLLPFEKVEQPRITDVALDVALYPKQARAVTHGRYTVVNRSAAPIGTLHVGWDETLRLDAIELAGATVQADYPRFHYRIYRLATPLQPGEQRVVGFTTTLEERGFPNSAPLLSIVDNGSFVNNTQLAPRIGFSRAGLLEDRAKRRKYGLPPELRPAKLEDDAARAFNVLSHDSDWVNADITVSTDADQTPIAPGRTVSDVVAGPRHTVRFVSDAPINHFFSIQSARYDMRRAVWKGPGHDVDLRVYYAPAHGFDVERMLDAMGLSLTLFTERYGPYQFNQARIVEFPDYAAFAQSFANTIPFSEGIGFIQHPKPGVDIDTITYVTAHEMAHQWWGHQLVPADQQGASMLVETFAQYSAVLVMEKKYGRDAVRRFLKYELDRYLRSRGGAVLEELPLDRVEDQDYIYYRKGALAMYWAKEVLGEDVVDGAMKKLLARYAFKGAPYANTRDFLEILRADAGPANDAIVSDLFDRITLLDLKASNAVATKRADGGFDLGFDVEAAKAWSDGAGKETAAPMDEPVDIGIFTARPGDKAFDSAKVLLLERRRVTSGKVHLQYVVKTAPAWVGIDPYNKRIDRNSDDNLAPVEVK